MDILRKSPLYVIPDMAPIGDACFHRLHRHRFSFLFLIGIFSCFLYIANFVNAAPNDDRNDVSERSVKAAFIYKFLGYIEWPAEPSSEPNPPLTIGTIGADDVAAELSRTVLDRTVNGRPIIVKRLQENDALTGIQLVFVGDLSRAALNRLVKTARQRSILVVTETEDALKLGSVINFVPVDGRIRFDVSLDAAEKSNIKLSSRMLSVARNVQKGPQ